MAYYFQDFKGGIYKDSFSAQCTFPSNVFKSMLNQENVNYEEVDLNF
jgi:hypothetical protein